MLVTQEMGDRYRTIISLKIASMDSQKEEIIPRNFRRTSKESLRENAYVSFMWIFIQFLTQCNLTFHNVYTLYTFCILS